MSVCGAPRGLDDELWAIAAAIDPQPAAREAQPLTPEQCRHVRFVLDLVDLLAERYGFDPATLANPRTGAPLAGDRAHARRGGGQRGLNPREKRSSGPVRDLGRYESLAETERVKRSSGRACDIARNKIIATAAPRPCRGRTWGRHGFGSHINQSSSMVRMRSAPRRPGTGRPRKPGRAPGGRMREAGRPALVPAFIEPGVCAPRRAYAPPGAPGRSAAGFGAGAGTRTTPGGSKRSAAPSNPPTLAAWRISPYTPTVSQ